MKRILPLILAALFSVGIVTTQPATASTITPKAAASVPPVHTNASGYCVTTYQNPAYPVYQILDLTQGVNGPLNYPLYLPPSSTKILVYTYAYGYTFGWTSYANAGHDTLYWGGGIITVPADYLGGPYILVYLPTAQTVGIGNCQI